MKQKSDADFFIDITDEICPMTFVKTKLLFERAAIGQTVEVRLKGREPLDNVPRNITYHGHQILDLTAEDASQPIDGIHRLVFRKAK
ncbi:MAG: SirA protein [Rhodospirillaceae bacterium TMED8]|nr:SirA protein [Magnetovibrio sp.]OUT50430.1 MAG: SirA protein [Rhodospirillaceae bacterium TMED8]|tara:strand:+ start:281 stop:541 length:261 start_codon:yes stop_codon:yes gene_type:complete